MGTVRGNSSPYSGSVMCLSLTPPYGIDFHTNFTTARKRLPKTRGGENRIAGDKERFGPPMYSGGPTYRNVRGCETSHFLTSPLSVEQQHTHMINHLKGLRGTRGR